MKHPVDTSQWGEFLLNDIATLTNGNKFDKNKMSHDNPSINFVSRTRFNNGISDFVDKIEGTEPYPAGAITLALGGSVGSTFVQPKPFYTGQNVGVIEFENKSDKMKQFVAVVLNKVCITQFNAFKNEINKHFKRDLSIPLPLKPSADPSDYTQADIDWNYMETVMSRVTTRAKERLASLPQPTDKKKTPVDTSAWGEFVVGELFDKCDLKRIKPDFNKHADLSSTPSEEFNLPLINAKVGNNGIMYYGRSSDWEAETMTLDIVNDGAASTGMVYAQPQATGTLYNAYQIKLKPSVHQNLTVSQLLFLATTTQASIQNKFSYENKAIWNKVKAETIKLPLKPSASPSNYTQEDIDWDYMENFMKTIEEKAHNRLKTLQKTIA